jgi:hypothetical protein
MPIPSSGTSWKAAAILIRDNRGAATNISPYVVGSVNEVQTVTITGTPTGGTFTLTYSGQTTAAIAYNATAAAVDSALEALSNVGAGQVAVTGGPGPGTPYVVTFTGTLAGKNVNQMTATGTFTGGTTPTIAVTTTTPGAGVQRNWSPFAADGTVRSDLFAMIRSSGEWITNPTSNEGFWLIGAVTEDGGIERAPNISQDNAMILQSNYPFDSDLTEEGLTINFTGVETLKPLMKRLRLNLPLSDSNGNAIVEDPGKKDFVMSKPTDTDSPERQIVLLFARRKGGRFFYTAEGYSLCKLTDIGSYSRSKTDPDAAQLGFTVLPDPYLVDIDPGNPNSNDLVPVLYSEWHAGTGWTTIGGVPVFPGAAPVATAVAGQLRATITFSNLTGAGDPFTITAEKNPSAAGFVAATVDAVELDTPTAGTTRVTVSGLTAVSTTFRLTATGTNGQTAVSQTSNAVTPS